MNVLKLLEKRQIFGTMYQEYGKEVKMSIISAQKAKDLTKGKCYADKALIDCMYSIKSSCAAGKNYTIIYFEGSTNISFDQYVILIDKLKKLGYKTSGKNTHPLHISW